MTQDHELKPLNCPICGNEVNTYQIYGSKEYLKENNIIRDDGWRISCSECSCHYGDCYQSWTEKEIINRWNERASERRLSEEKIIEIMLNASHGIIHQSDAIHATQAIIQAYNEGKLWEDAT